MTQQLLLVEGFIRKWYDLEKCVKHLQEPGVKVVAQQTCFFFKMYLSMINLYSLKVAFMCVRAMSVGICWN